MIQRALVSILVVFLFLPAQAQTNPASEQRASLRLTHLMFAAVLEQYMQEGREKYRPDFLLHGRYLRTFLYEWSLILDKQNPTSTVEVWNQIAARKSYLGGYFELWRNALPSYYDVRDVSKQINIGYQRETFLVRVLRSENNRSFNDRSKQIVDFIEAHLRPEASNIGLTMTLLEAFTSHPVREIREQAKISIDSFDRYFWTLQGLTLARNLALGLQAGGPGKWAPRITAVTSRARQITQLWTRRSLIQKAAVTSVALHAAPFAFDAKRSVENSDESTSTGVSGADAFIADLALSVAPDLSSLQIEQTDFALPLATKFPSREDWLNEGRRLLQVWNNGEKISGLADFFLEGERQGGYWPNDHELARLTTLSRYLRLKQRLIQMKVSNIDDFRDEVLANELQDYRGQRRTLTSMMLDWGGNCVSQTLTLISLLADFPQLVPQGSTLGVYMSPTHMEAVLVSKAGVKFLVSGELRPLSRPVTVLKPQTLIVSALRSLGDKTVQIDSSYYLLGQPPAGDKKPWQGKLAQVFDALKRGDFESGLANSGDIPSLGLPHATKAPDHAKVGDGESDSADGSVEGSFFGSLSPASRGSDVVKQRPARIEIENRRVEICAEYFVKGKYMKCKFSKRKLQPVRLSWYDVENLYFDSTDDNQKIQKLRSDIDQIMIPSLLDEVSVLNSIPREFWILYANQRFMKEYLAGTEVDAATEARWRQLEFRLDDIAPIMSFGKIHDLGFSLVASKWIALLGVLHPSLKQYSDSAPPKGHPIEMAHAFVKASKAYRELLLKMYGDDKASRALLESSFSIEELEARLKLHDTLVDAMNSNPEKFVRAFPSILPTLKTVLMRFARDLSFMERSRLQKLSAFVAALKPEDIQMKRPTPVKTEVCRPVEIRTATCSSPEGCKAFQVIQPKQCTPQPPDTIVMAKTKRDRQEDSHRTFDLSPGDVAQLTLIAGAGFNLWSSPVVEAADAASAEWLDVPFSLHDVVETIDSTPDASKSAIENRKNAIKWLEKFWQQMVARVAHDASPSARKPRQ